MSPLTTLLPFLVDGADKVPAPEDVKAGWVAFGVFVGLAIAVALLGISLTRHLRKVRANAERGGVYDESTPPRETRPTGFPTAEPQRRGTDPGPDGPRHQPSAG